MVRPMIGSKYNRLTILGRAEKTDKFGAIHVLCKCECGNEVIVRKNAVTGGNTRSCGCLASELTAKRNRTHGQSGTPEYETWCRMVKRCSNPNAVNWKYYGGRGIRICPEWRNSFETFLAHVGPRPSSKHSIDRIDNNGHYEPDNVRWTTADVQAKNRRFNQPRGSATKSAKLDEEKVVEILARLRDGETGRTLATEFGVTAALISNIKRGRAWPHVPREI